MQAKVFKTLAVDITVIFIIKQTNFQRSNELKCVWMLSSFVLHSFSVVIKHYYITLQLLYIIIITLQFPCFFSTNFISTSSLLVLHLLDS